MARLVVLGALLVAFGALVTVHLAIAIRLAVSAKPRYRGLVAFFVPPLAPVWAYRENWRKLCWVWIVAILVYAASLAVSSFVA